MSSLRDAIASMPNPLSSSSASANDGVAVDVAELHGDARMAFVRGLWRARRGYPHLLVLLGEAGAGKSHLLSWLRQQHHITDAVGQIEVCVPLPALPDLAQPFRHALRHLVGTLSRRDEAPPPPAATPQAATPPPALLSRPIDVLLWQTLFIQAIDLLDAARVGTYQGPAALMKTLGPLCLDAGKPRPLRAFAEDAQKVWDKVEPGLRSYLLSLPTEMSIDSTARAVTVQFPYPDRKALVTSWLAGEDLSPKDRERLGAKQVINNESAAKYVLTSLVRLMAASGAQLTILFDQAEQTIEQLKQPGLQALAEVILAVQQSGGGALQILSCRPATWRLLQDKPARPGPAQLKQVDQIVQLSRPKPEHLRELVAARISAAFAEEMPRPGPLYPLVEADLSSLGEVDTPRAALAAMAQRFEERRAEAASVSGKNRTKDAPSLSGGAGAASGKVTAKDGPSRQGAAKPAAKEAEAPNLKSASGRMVLPLQPFTNDSSPTLRALAEQKAAAAAKPAKPGKPTGDAETPFLNDSSPTQEAVMQDVVAVARAKSKPRIEDEVPENATLAMSQDMLEAALGQPEGTLGAARRSGSQHPGPASAGAAASKPTASKPIGVAKPAAKPTAAKPSVITVKPSAAVLKPVTARTPDEGDNPTMAMTDEALQRALGGDSAAIAAAVAPGGAAKPAAAKPGVAKPSVVAIKPSAVALKPVSAKPAAGDGAKLSVGDNPTMAMTDEALRRALGDDLGAATKAAAPSKPPAAGKPVGAVAIKPSAITLKPVSVKPPEGDNPTMAMTDEALRRALGDDLGTAMGAAAKAAAPSKPAAAAASKPVAAAKKPSPAPKAPAATKPASRPEQDNPTMAMSQEMLLAALQSAESAVDERSSERSARTSGSSSGTPGFLADSNPTVKHAPEAALLREAERSRPGGSRTEPVRVKPPAAKPSSQPPTMGRVAPLAVAPARSGPIPATGVKAPAANVPEPLPDSASTPSQGWLAMADDNPLAQAIAKAQADLGVPSKPAKTTGSKDRVSTQKAAQGGIHKPIPATGVKPPPATNVPEPLPDSASSPSQGWLAMAGDEDPLAQALAKADLGKSGPRSTQAKLPALQLRGEQTMTPKQILGRLGTRDMVEDWQLAEELGVGLPALSQVLERMEDDGQIRVMPRGDTRVIVRV